MIGVYIIIIVVIIVIFAMWFIHHQRKLRIRAHLMQEAIRNRDFTFHLPVNGLLSGERAMQETMNQMGDVIREQINQNEVESWERLTRVLTHEIMNATAPITSISQSMLNHEKVKGTSLEEGIHAIYETSHHLSEFIANYRKMSELEKPVLTTVKLYAMTEEVSKAYPQLMWDISMPVDLTVHADAGMLRQILMNLVRNAIEAKARKIVIDVVNDSLRDKQVSLYIGNDGLPIPAENRRSLFVPFFTTKRNGNGIVLSLSRRMMIQQGGMLDLAEHSFQGCHAGFVLTFMLTNSDTSD